MDVNQTFKARLAEIMAQKDMKAPEVAAKSGLNRRMVYDLIEGRSTSPKIETVFKLARGLGVEPADLLGLGQSVPLHPSLAELLGKYPLAEQEQLAKALAQLPRGPGSSR